MEPSLRVTSRTRPTPRIAAWGGLITGVKVSTLKPSSELTVKVPPETSSTTERAVLHPVGEDRHLPGELLQRHAIGALEHGHHQPVLVIHREAHVHLGLDDDLIPMEAGVEPGVLAQRKRGRLHDEHRERDHHTLASPLAIEAVELLHRRFDVDLAGQRELRHRPQALVHALADGAPPPAVRDGRVDDGGAGRGC